MFDLNDENDRVSDQNTDQCQYAENGDETHRRVGEQQRCHHADQRRRSNGKDKKQPAEALQLNHKDRCHRKQHQRHHGYDWRLRIRAGFHRASYFHLVPHGSDFSKASSFGFNCSTIVAGCVGPMMAALTVTVGILSRRQMVGCSSS